jgi:hypothetical protein
MRISFPGAPSHGGGGADDEGRVADGPIRFVRGDGRMEGIKHEILQTDKEKIALPAGRPASIVPSSPGMAGKLFFASRPGGWYAP